MKKEMQKPITQAELKTILAMWPADFSGRLLVGIDLSHNRNLECADFRDAILRECTIYQCKLDNSHFEGADLGDTAFIGCKMECCHFNGTQMEEASFDRCALFGSAGLNGDNRLQSEVIFDDTMGIIRGINMACAPDWRQFAWEICEWDEENYGTMLCELQERFHEIDNAYPGMGAEIFNCGLHFMPHELRGAANCIAQGNTVETAHPLAVDSAFSCADVLPEHEMFVLPHSDVQKNILAERAFVAQVKMIPGVDFGKLSDWLELARELADDEGDDYHQLLRKFGDAFEQIEQRYDGIAAEIFNHEAGYLPGELLPAAEWISNGGSPEEAVEMAKCGAFEGGAAADFGPAMTM